VLHRIPLALVALRALLAPVVALLAVFHPRPALFGLFLVLALLSDYFDGALARRWNVSSTALRRLDSIADSAFYLGALFAAWYLYPAVIREHLAGLLVLAALELLRYVFDAIKFRREASYHMWSAKLWGVCLFVAFFCLLVLGLAAPWFALALYVGILPDLGGLAISIALREWRTDVPSLAHALRIRR